MTTTDRPVSAPVIPEITAPMGSRLEQLTAQYDQAKQLADDAAERLKAITDGIKAELGAAAPGASRVILRSRYLARSLRLRAQVSWRLDMKSLKAERPEVYARYAYPATAWYLEQIR